MGMPLWLRYCGTVQNLFNVIVIVDYVMCLNSMLMESVEPWVVSQMLMRPRELSC